MRDNIISKHIGFDWADDVELLCKKLILQHKWSNKNYNRGEYVFDIAPSNLGFFQPLFDIIKQEVITLYPKADIPDRIFNKSWAYVSNQDRTVSFMHNHMSEKIRKDISTVFYLKKPPHSGDIMFLLGDEEYIHTPVEGELLIFPATYYHSPLPSQTKEYRIAINVSMNTSLTMIGMSSIIMSLVQKSMSNKGSFLSRFKNKSQVLVSAIENKIDLEYDHPSLYNSLRSYYQTQEIYFYNDRDKDYDIIMENLEYDLLNTGFIG